MAASLWQNLPADASVTACKPVVLQFVIATRFTLLRDRDAGACGAHELPLRRVGARHCVPRGPACEPLAKISGAMNNIVMIHPARQLVGTLRMRRFMQTPVGTYFQY